MRAVSRGRNVPRFALCGAVFRSAAVASECNRFRWWEALAQSRVLERGRVFRLGQALQSRKPLCGLGERDGQVHTRVHGRVLLEVRHKVGVRSPGGILRGRIAPLCQPYQPSRRALAGAHALKRNWCRYYLLSGHCLPCVEKDLTQMRRANNFFLLCTIIATLVLPTILLTYW
jgi:hypothetical protein